MDGIDQDNVLLLVREQVGDFDLCYLHSVNHVRFHHSKTVNVFQCIRDWHNLYTQNGKCIYYKSRQ